MNIPSDSYLPVLQGKVSHQIVWLRVGGNGRKRSYLHQYLFDPTDIVILKDFKKFSSSTSDIEHPGTMFKVGEERQLSHLNLLPGTSEPFFKEKIC